MKLQACKRSTEMSNDGVKLSCHEHNNILEIFRIFLKIETENSEWSFPQQFGNVLDLRIIHDWPAQTDTVTVTLLFSSCKTGSWEEQGGNTGQPFLFYDEDVAVCLHAATTQVRPQLAVKVANPHVSLYFDLTCQPYAYSSQPSTGYA